jgi:CRISPR-associated protein Cst2
MVKAINGLLLVDAPFSALNNIGSDEGDRTDNITRTKIIRRGSNKYYPYVSGQAVRYWWRSTLEREKNWTLSPITRETKIAFTEANPIDYPDDDIFGYMRAPKGRNSETVTRVSPLKVSPLISITSTKPTEDFGTMSRHKGDPVPYEHEFYSTVLKGIFSIDLESVGRFYNQKRSGFQNLTSAIIETKTQSLKSVKNLENTWELNENTRKQRIKDVIEVLPYFSGGAKLSSHHTDVAPKFLVLGVMDVGYHSFYHTITEESEKPVFNKISFQKILQDYKDRIYSKIYIGREPGFFDEWENLINELVLENPNKYVYGTIKEVSTKFLAEIENQTF